MNSDLVLTLSTTQLDKYHSLLDMLIAKYSLDPYMSVRLINYLEHLLPSILETEAIQYTQREERKKQLTEYRDEFTTRFLLKNKYFYSHQTDLFLHYDGLHFVIYSEDDIQHQILSTITSEQSLMAWKHKIKANILKQIKERSLLKAIPESATIQYVLNQLYPTFFPSRNLAKYFLTVIGDSLLFNSRNEEDKDKTVEPLIYITAHTVKNFIREIGNQCYTFFGVSNAFSNIKFKYYEHDYSACRLLQMAPLTTNIINTCFQGNRHLLDLLCVAAHYSFRYGSADYFLKQCSETRLADHALFLQRNSLQTIVATFIETSLTPCIGTHIAFKNIIFLWKKFLEKKDVPNIVFYGPLKTVLKEQLKYDGNGDCFLNMTSVHLPLVSNFMKFWELTISEDDNEPELEIEELAILFKSWLGKTHYFNLSDTILLELIRHFYPEIMIDENKYLLHVKCSLWDKRTEITNALALFKMTDLPVAHSSKSLYEAYEHYLLSKQPLGVLETSEPGAIAPPTESADKKLIKPPIKKKGGGGKNITCIASKRYFEKVAAELIEGHLDQDGLISPTWWKKE